VDGSVGSRFANRTATDFAAEAGELGGRSYGAERLDALGRYLDRRGVRLEVGSPDLPFGKAGAFESSPDGTARLLLKADPTNQLVWHELGHFIQWRKVGPEAYLKLPRGPLHGDTFNAPEQFVFDLLNQPSRWDRLTPEYQQHLIDYIEDPKTGGFR
jgi:hypothetical protein